MGRRLLRLRLGFLAMALAAATVAAGCGGDDEAPAVTSVTTGTSGLTGATGAGGSMDEFLDEADDICAESNVAIANLGLSEAGSTAAQELSITEGQADSLRSLGNPPEDARTWGDLLDALDQQVEALEESELAAQRGEDTTAADAEAAEARLDVQAAAEDLGLKDCGQEGEPSGSRGGGNAGGGADATTPTAPAPAPAPTPAPAPAPTPAPEPPSGGTGGGGGGGTGGVSP